MPCVSSLHCFDCWSLAFFTSTLWRYYAKHTTSPAFLKNICKILHVRNERRSAMNFGMMVSSLSIPENSYILFDVLVKYSPEVYAHFFCTPTSPLVFLLFFLFQIAHSPNPSGVFLLHASWRLHGLRWKLERRDWVSFPLKSFSISIIRSSLFTLITFRSVSFENVQVWPVNGNDTPNKVSIESAQQHFNISSPVSSMVVAL